MREAARWIVPAAIFTSLVSPAGATPSESVRACTDAYERAQELRAAHRLRLARTKLLVCGAAACPARLSRDCIAWLTEVDDTLPTVVVEARAPDGSSVVAARLVVDGEVMGETLDGNAVAMDPGLRRVRVEAPGRPPAEEEVAVRAGQKNQRVTINLGKRTDERAPAPAPIVERSSGTPALAFVLGGIAIASAGIGTYFGLAGLSKRGELDSAGCKPTCPTSDVDTVKRDYLVSEISIAVAIGAAAGATYLVLSRSDKNGPEAWLRATPSRAGGTVTFGAGF